MNSPEPWLCPTCRKPVSSTFCPDCGERQLDSHALTVRGLAEQIFLSLTSVDSKLIRSVWSLVARPGALTVAYLDGRRKPYLGPVPLFLMANVLFFAVESLLRSGVLATPLAMHLEREPWSPLAQMWVANRVAALQTTLDAFTPVFDQALALHARSWIIVMALSFTPVPLVLFLRRRMPVAAHAVFALHLYAFLLLLMSAGTAVEALFGGPTSMPAWLDPVVSIALLAACAAYLYRAVGAVYATRGARRLLEVIVLAVGVAALVLGYRFALFVLTLYTA
jgi:uncharacterized protein DUF3667